MGRRFAAVAILLASLGACAQQADDRIDAVDQSLVGRVVFPTSCDATVQPRINVAVALLHSFWFTASDSTFDSIIASDPDCAIGYAPLR